MFYMKVNKEAFFLLYLHYFSIGLVYFNYMQYILFLLCLFLLSSCGNDKPSAVEVSSSPVSSSIKISSSNEVKESSSIENSSSSIKSSSIKSSSSSISSSSDSGICTSCDSFTPSDPEVTENGGSGSITTYGSISAKETSQGGACNYGETGIQYYAAIHVNVSSGDDLGPWDNGLACGGCVSVKAKTLTGWKTTIVRITDKCPDEYCGVDLGGAPASDIMGIQVGRYEGEWEFVSCKGIESVYGDSTSIYTKEGANPYWSVIQVRNPQDAVKGISLVNLNDSSLYKLELAIEAENYWSVPKEVLQSEAPFAITVTYRSGDPETWFLTGNDLSKEQTTYYFFEHKTNEIK